jgi:hypothetical protein
LFFWASAMWALTSRRWRLWFIGKQKHWSDFSESAAVYPMELVLFVYFKHFLARWDCDHFLRFLIGGLGRVFCWWTFKKFLFYLLRCAWLIISRWKWALFC